MRRVVGVVTPGKSGERSATRAYKTVEWRTIELPVHCGIGPTRGDIDALAQRHEYLPQIWLDLLLKVSHESASNYRIAHHRGPRTRWHWATSRDIIGTGEPPEAWASSERRGELVVESGDEVLLRHSSGV